ncbi:hypothetical protein F5I97DRAFT_613811 [Phlebopus sp. FC_14]|nr:hypothetical protein F5I97DRAFT_613811 [Phlebopus sp. FC_14]
MMGQSCGNQSSSLVEGRVCGWKPSVPSVPQVVVDIRLQLRKSPLDLLLRKRSGMQASRLPYLPPIVIHCIPPLKNRPPPKPSTPERKPKRQEKSILPPTVDTTSRAVTVSNIEYLQLLVQRHGDDIETLTKGSLCRRNAALCADNANSQQEREKLENMVKCLEEKGKCRRNVTSSKEGTWKMIGNMPKNAAGFQREAIEESHRCTGLLDEVTRLETQTKSPLSQYDTSKSVTLSGSSSASRQCDLRRLDSRGMGELISPFVEAGKKCATSFLI